MDRAKELDKLDARRDTEKAGGEDNGADRQRREDLINQFALITGAGFEAFEVAVERVRSALSVPEKAKGAPGWVHLLDIAIGAVLAGTAGSIGQYAANAIANLVAKKFVGDAVKDAVSKALKPHRSSAEPATTDLARAFMRPLEAKQVSQRSDLAATWTTLASRMRQVPLEDLERMNQQDVGRLNLELVDTIERHILIGWTNFLARAVHGGMGAWDPWQRYGRDDTTTIARHPIPLRGAAKNPYDTPEAERVDPLLNNVEPKNMYWAVDDDQRPMEGEHVGILEIHLWANGAMNLEPSYGMRLDNVGPAVRKTFKESRMTVRDLPINKIVRVSNTGASQIVPPRADAAFLITADGHIRLTSWPHPKEWLVPTAERAQDLPLSKLEA